MAEEIVDWRDGFIEKFPAKSAAPYGRGPNGVMTYGPRKKTMVPSPTNPKTPKNPIGNEDLMDGDNTNNDAMQDDGGSD
jgi:hypothetical protein